MALWTQPADILSRFRYARIMCLYTRAKWMDGDVMGRLKFPHELRLDLDDWALAHLHAAMQVKLRRGESFHLSWPHDISTGPGRTTTWVHSETSWVCTIGSRTGELDRRWVEAFVATANSVGGMQIVPRPAADDVPSKEVPRGEVSL